MEIDFQMRYGLACVKYEHRAHLMRTPDDGCDIGDGTGGVPHMRDGDDFRAFGNHLVGAIGTDTTLIVQIEPLQAGSGAGRQFLEWQQHRMMLGFGHHDLVTRLEGEAFGRRSSTTERGIAEGRGQQIQPCGRAGGDDDLLLAFRRIGADQPGHLGAGLLERHGAARGKLVGTAVHAGVDRPIEFRFRVNHALRFLRGRGGVQIHQRMPVNLLVQNRKFLTNRCKIRHASALSESAPSGRYAS